MRTHLVLNVEICEIRIVVGLAEESVAELSLATLIRRLLSIRLLISIMVYGALSDVLEYHGSGIDATSLRFVPTATIELVHIVYGSPTECVQTVVVHLAAALTLSLKLLLRRPFAVTIVIVYTVYAGWIRYLPPNATYFA